MDEKRTSFEKDLGSLINKYSIENLSDTPDFLLARALSEFLATLSSVIRAREKWYGREPKNIHTAIEEMPK